MKALTLRNIDIDTAEMMKKKAFDEGMSVNRFLLKMIHETLGISKKKRNKVHHDLDKLAGTWSKKDFDEFEKSTSIFSKIDKEMWK